MTAPRLGSPMGAFHADGDDARWWRVASSLLQAPSPPGPPRALPRVLDEDRPRPVATRPSTALPAGRAVAALLAAGVACAVFGVMVIIAEASAEVAALLSHPAAVGPLSGKALVTVAAWLGTWSILHCWLRRLDADPGPLLRLALALTCLGFLATFPPIFQLFSR